MERKELKKLLKNAGSVLIEDMSDYVPGKADSGGCYIWRWLYQRAAKNRWEIYYSTSAAYAFCEKCGCFFHNAEECSLDYQVCTTEELIDVILDCLEKEKDWDFSVQNTYNNFNIIAYIDGETIEII